jgi:hypothetical protein
MSKIKEKERILKIQIAFTLIFIAFLLFTIANSCSSSSAKAQKNISDFTYEIVKVEGMTCIKWGRLSAYKGALTCNWDEWEKAE